MTGNDTARTVFDTFDVNKDGFLTPDEFRQVMSELGVADLTATQARTLLGRQDADGDGTVSFEEFLSAYERAGRS
ncbi:EF-hand domain-containing protein [Streptomyces odontomachi]|uniref:EF-hand domain-containing protein n=1 Tax=Streptomyces odontomachi TaxID=2944940 RepID=UPI00210A1E32|nr:EF-hand domain-containing protein [Streptomyces sp. ODS25]